LPGLRGVPIAPGVVLLVGCLGCIGQRDSGNCIVVEQRIRGRWPACSGSIAFWLNDARQGSVAVEPAAKHLFRNLWIASIVSNLGTWMHDVGAGWLMTSLSSSPSMVHW